MSTIGKSQLYRDLIHWGIVLVIVIATTVLALRHVLDSASTTAIFGTALGHAGTSAQGRISGRQETER